MGADPWLLPQGFVDAMPNGFALFSVAGGESVGASDVRFVQVNPALASILSLSPDSLVGQTISAVASATLADRIEPILLRVAQTGQPEQHELDLPELQKRFACSVFSQSAGLVSLMTTDTTSQWQAEEALRASETKYETVFRTSPDAIWISRLDDGTFLEANEGFARLIGYELNELIGRTSLEVGIWPDPRDRHRLAGAFRDVGSLSEQVAELRRKNGDAILAAVSGRLIELRGETCILGVARDISEQKRTEEALRQNEARYRELVRYSGDPIFSFDRQGRYIFVNEAFARPFGKTPEQIVGSTPYDLFSPDQAEKRLATVRRVFDTGIGKEIEVPVDTVAGETRYYLTIADPVRDDSGAVVSVSCISKDITERKRAEQRIHDQYATLVGILESTDSPIFALDTSYRYISFNRSHARVMKALYDADIEIGRSLLDYQTVQEDRNRAKENLDRALRGERFYDEAYSGEEGLVRTCFVVWHNPIKAADGTVVGVAVFSSDVSERKRAEEALRESERRFSLAFHASPVAMGITRTGNGTIVDVNQKWLDLYGLTREQVVDRSPVDLGIYVDPSDRALIVQDLARSGSIHEYEFQVHASGGEVRDVRISAETAQLGDDPVFLSVTQDVTDRRRAERALRESDAVLRTVFSTMRDAVVVMALDGTILECNEASLRQTGLRREEWIGSNGFDVVAAEDRERARASALDALSEGHGRAEVRIVRPDGTSFDGEMVGGVLWDAASGSTGYVIVTRDITERRQAERALRESEERYRRLTEASFEGVAISVETRIVDASSRLADMLGYSLDEIVGLPGLELFAPECRDQVAERTRQGDTAAYEAVALRKDGTTFPVEVRPRLMEYRGQSARLAAVRDITERMRAEQAIRESEERFRQAIENSQAGYFQIGADGCFQHVNRTWLSMHGYDSLDEVIGRSFDLTQLPADCAEAGRIVDFVLGGGRVSSGEFSRLRKDGTVGYHQYSVVPVHRGGQVTGAEGFLIDSTDRRRFEEELRKRNAFVEAVLENAPIGFAVNTIHDGKQVFTSRRFDSIYGLQPGTVRDVDDFFVKVYPDPAFRNEMRERIISDIATGDPARMRWESIPIGPHGADQRIVSAINIPLPDQDLMISTVQDVTSRKRAEDALAASEHKYRQIVELAHEGIWSIDAAGNTTFVNPRMAEMLGYEVDEMIGRNMFSFTDERGTEIARADLALRRQGLAEQRETDFEFLHKDGDRVYIRLHTSPVLDERGLYQGSIGMIEDVTERRRAEAERKELEQRLFQAEKMEAIGNLAGGIAHDFNNMLNIVLGNASLLELDLPPSSPMLEAIHTIETACDRGAALTRQLLGFARRGRYEVRPVNAALLIDDVAKFVRPTFDRSITINTRTAGDTWTVVGDPNQLHQVLMNMAINSRDAMPNGGTLMLSASNAELAEAETRTQPGVRPGRYVLFTVADTGTGMSKETRERIFDPFFTTKAAGKGTGLGLASAYGIVQNHGGHIDVDTELGKGTTMRVYLPASDTGRPDTAENSPTNPMRPGTATVLLVDDEQAVRDLGASALERLGYTVLLAGDGREGFETYRSHQAEIDLVILDMSMPVQGGNATAKQLLALNPECRILLATGYSADSEAADLLTRVTISFLQKPFRAGELADAVGQALGFR
jgi:two-component system, cell cycle sensor histidine kinase and response regulator CckA